MGRPPKALTLASVVAEVKALEAAGERPAQYLVCAALDVHPHTMSRRYAEWGFASWDELVAAIAESGPGTICPTCGARTVDLSVPDSVPA